MNGHSVRALHVVVLAAGFSSRLGQAKALARVRGRSLLARTLRLARNLHASSIIVIIPPNAPRYRIIAQRMNVGWAVNSQRMQGLSSSVRRGIDAARYGSAILFLPTDLPYLKSREVARLLRRWQSSPRRLIARKLADAGGIPLILPKWLFPTARAISGDIGLRELIAKLPREQCAFVELPSAAIDVDTKQALAEARRRFRGLG